MSWYYWSIWIPLASAQTPQYRVAWRFIINSKAREIIRLVASLCLCACPNSPVWTAKSPYETQSEYTLTNCGTLISWGFQNFCALAVMHIFFNCTEYIMRYHSCTCKESVSVSCTSCTYMYEVYCWSVACMWPASCHVIITSKSLNWCYYLLVPHKLIPGW